MRWALRVLRMSLAKPTMKILTHLHLFSLASFFELLGLVDGNLAATEALKSSGLLGFQGVGMKEA